MTKARQLLLTLWDNAVDRPNYSKDEWRELSVILDRYETYLSAMCEMFPPYFDDFMNSSKGKKLVEVMKLIRADVEPPVQP